MLETGEKIFYPKSLFGHIWSCCDLDVWPFDHKI